MIVYCECWKKTYPTGSHRGDAHTNTFYIYTIHTDIQIPIYRYTIHTHAFFHDTNTHTHTPLLVQTNNCPHPLSPISLSLSLAVDPCARGLPDGGVGGHVQSQGAEGRPTGGDGAVGRHPLRAARARTQPQDLLLRQRAPGVSYSVPHSRKRLALSQEVCVVCTSQVAILNALMRSNWHFLSFFLFVFLYFCISLFLPSFFLSSFFVACTV